MSFYEFNDEQKKIMDEFIEKIGRILANTFITDEFINLSISTTAMLESLSICLVITICNSFTNYELRHQVNKEIYNGIKSCINNVNSIERDLS